MFGFLKSQNRANTFAVAQGARQRDHTLDMAIAELDAAVAADQRHAAGQHQLLLLHMRVEPAQIWLAFQKQKQIGERNFARFGV